MEALNIWEWLKTGWGLALMVSAAIASFYAVKNNISKLVTDIKKPVTDLKVQIDSLDKKIDIKIAEQTKAFEEEVGKIDARLDQMAEHNQMADDALKAMLKSDMLKNCEKYLKSGWATVQQKEVLSKQLDSYQALKGNTFICDLVAQVQALPLEDPKKKSLNE